jgi:hypothetical protein
MSTWVYSTEAFPHDKLTGKPGYTPEIPMYLGITLPLQAKTWTVLPTRYPTLTHRDWTDRSGTRGFIYTEEVIKGLKPQYEKRGVIFLDHEPTPSEKEMLPKVSEEVNMTFRSDVIRNFEQQIREKEVTGHGRTKPTPYEDECYDLLGMHKPYSPEALRSARDPGSAAATKFAEAITAALKADREALLNTKVDSATHKTPLPKPAHSA